MFANLFTRLSLIFLIVVALLGAFLLYTSQRISEQYGMEVMQRLNSSVAMYVTEQGQLIDENKQLDQPLFERLTSHAMILNPSIDIYILDDNGKIIAPTSALSAAAQSQINLQPVKQYLAEDLSMPILGDDPKSVDTKKVFSVSPIINENKLLGYVYVVIGGQQYQQLKSSVTDNYLYRLGGVLMLVSLLAAFIVGCITFFFLTRRLTRLKTKIQAVDSSLDSMGTLDSTQDLNMSHEKNDEVGRLAQALESMASNIHQQYATLQKK